MKLSEVSDWGSGTAVWCWDVVSLRPICWLICIHKSDVARLVDILRWVIGMLTPQAKQGFYSPAITWWAHWEYAFLGSNWWLQDPWLLWEFYPSLNLRHRGSWGGWGGVRGYWRSVRGCQENSTSYIFLHLMYTFSPILNPIPLFPFIAPLNLTS